MSSLEKTAIALDEMREKRKLLLVPNVDFEGFMKSRHQDYAAVRGAEDYREEVQEYFSAGGSLQGLMLPWQKTHDLIRLRPREVSCWHGWNGQGKSLVLGQVVSHLARQGEKCCIASMEMHPYKTLARMTRQELGTVSPTAEAIDSHLNWCIGKIWMYDQTETVSTDRILAVIEYVVETYGITQFVIDSLMKCGVTKDSSHGTYCAQMKIVEELCAIAKKTNVHIHLVAHDKKPEDERDRPHKYMISGSSDISNQVDNCFGVWWNKERYHAKHEHEHEADAEIICDKQRNGDWEGTVKLWVHDGSKRYLGSEGEKVWPLLK